MKCSWRKWAVQLFVIANLLPLLACSKSAAAEEIKFDSVKMSLKDKPFTVEVADTEEKRERGLMNRESMAADHGMLFVFDKADIYAFWMKDTKIPLDLVFLDASGKVVGIYSLKPNDMTQVSCEKKALFALELNAETAKALGLKTGDTVELPEKVLKRTSRSDEK